jgi:hypothetical protein
MRCSELTSCRQPLTLTAFVCNTPAAAQTEAVLRNFISNSGTIGYVPDSLIRDSAGNLYGVNSQGGPYNSGVVFELTPKSGGGWLPTLLRAFNPAQGDGTGPGGLVFGPSGHLYGVTGGGGANGDGTISKCSRSPADTGEKRLYTALPSRIPLAQRSMLRATSRGQLLTEVPAMLPATYIN